MAMHSTKSGNYLTQMPVQEKLTLHLLNVRLTYKNQFCKNYVSIFKKKFSVDKWTTFITDFYLNVPAKC